MPGEIRLGCIMIAGLVLGGSLCFVVIRLLISSIWKINVRRFSIIYLSFCLIVVSMMSGLVFKNIVAMIVCLCVWILLAYLLQRGVRKDIFCEEKNGNFYYQIRLSTKKNNDIILSNELDLYNEQALENDSKWPTKRLMAYAIIPALIIDFIYILMLNGVIPNFLLFLIE